VSSVRMRMTVVVAVVVLIAAAVRVAVRTCTVRVAVRASTVPVARLTAVRVPVSFGPPQRVWRQRTLLHLIDEAEHGGVGHLSCRFQLHEGIGQGKSTNAEGRPETQRRLECWGCPAKPLSRRAY